MKEIRQYYNTNNPSHFSILQNKIAALHSGEYIILIKKKKSIRSLNQNAYLNGVVYKLISDFTGYNPSDIHRDLKKEFGFKELKTNIITGKEEEILRSTSTYDSKEMTIYIDKIILWAKDFLGLQIPLPNEEISRIIYENNYI